MIRILTALVSLAATSAAGDISLAQPVGCALGDTCHIQQTVDHDPGPGATDFRCGSLTYDGHKGTDFGLPTLAAMRAGVTVLAAAPGVVAGVRDGEPEGVQGRPGAADIARRECGNGVLVQHDDGWETQYCHMARGSITVKTGDPVDTGAPLGRIGLSGDTQFPHLHLSVRHDGAVVNPFDPDGAITCGAPSAQTLWADDIAAPPGGLLNAGLSDRVPDYDAIKDGTAPAGVTATSPLVLWGHYFANRAGDTLRLVITGPDGPVFDDTQTLERTQAQAFRAGGRRAPPEGWPAGVYRAEVILSRDGAELDRTETTARID